MLVPRPHRRRLPHPRQWCVPRSAKPTCIRAVYLGAPDDYAQVQDIPADVLLTPNSDGRYSVERGRQYTVVTAAQLPTGWTRFYLERTPLGDPRAVSHQQLIAPVGTTYTFTVTTDPGASTLITFDLKQARPFVRPRPDNKPEIGDTVVTTVFSVEAETLSYNAYDTTGAVATAGSYAFLTDAGSVTSTANIHVDLLAAEAIVVNVSDRDGASQAALYNNIKVDDVVEWYPVGYEDCWMRYKITALLPEPPGAPSRKRFAIKWLPVAHLMCVDDVLVDELEVELRWHPPAAHSDPHGGLPTMLMDQPVPGGASYYVAPFSALVVDVPEEMTLVRYTG